MRIADVGTIGTMTDRASPDESIRLTETLRDNGIAPHAEAIARITDAGDVAVVTYKLTPRSEEAARAAGWNGVAPVFRMGSAYRKRLIKACAVNTDHRTASWLRGKRAGRVFVIHGDETLLVKYLQGQGYSID